MSSKKIYHANTIKIHDTQIENSYPYVVRAATNNGIKGFIIDDPTFANEKNTLSFAQDTFTVFYQKQPYFTGNKVKILKPKFAFKSPKILYFISAILQFILKPLTWGLGSTTESIAEFKFSLPLKPTANAQTLDGIDFNFMEKFIAELEQCRLAELEAYLKATGLSNTTLSSDEENALNLFDGKNSGGGGNTPCGLTWQSFKLGDLFEIRPTKAYKLTNSHLFDSNAKNPVVTNSSLNNGISGYSSLEPTEKGNQITYSDTTTSEGIFYQKRPFIGYSHVQGLYSLKYHEFWNEKTLLYIVTAFKKVACGRFNYGNKFNRKIASGMPIFLSTNQHGGIDFHFMHTFINALMKQTIQGVVQYSRAKIQATKETISQETPTQKDSLF
ncbi:restriction endonuclease subunit S [Helicobacter pylori]|uniref:restriction endonuclease subunit S n=1 Tax=Helicobacter pylori TaxID=210 RepID=UPI00358F57A0